MKQRILTAVIALILLAPIIIYGGLPFILLAFIFAVIAVYELMRMYQPDKGILYTLLSVVFLWLILSPFDTAVIPISKYDVLLIFLVVLLTITVLSKNQFAFDHAGYIFIAVFYMGSAFHALIAARMSGLEYLLFILFVIWATDSGAYFAGKSIGKRKLWPAISPNKTIGGAIGGVLLAVITGAVFQLIHPFDHSFITILGITVLISVFGQLGDLAASAIKRHYDVKDFGKLFPGHGGILDRFDSLLFVLVILELIRFFPQ